MKIWIPDLKNYVGQTVELKGLAYHHRSSGKVKFLVVRDGTGYCQCVFAKGACDDQSFNDFEQITQESTDTVTGIVKAEPRNPSGYEITAQSFKLLSRA